MTDRPHILLAHHLKTPRLPTFPREYEKVARQCAAEGLDHVRFLARLVELELIDRERRMVERRIKAAKFPVAKSPDSFDFKAIPALNKARVLELARREWIERRENVIALGPSGTGKTHVALGLGLAACQRGLSTGFTTAATLVHKLMEARDERRPPRLQKQMVAGTLPIIDELGCQWRSKKGPPRRCKKGPLGGCGLVPVVHGRAPRATRRALNRLTRRRAREGPVGPRGQAWAGWSVQLAVGV